MNQILIVNNKGGKNNNNNGTVDIKKIVLFFSIAIIIFGIFLIINGINGLNNDKPKTTGTVTPTPQAPSSVAPVVNDTEPPVIELFLIGEKIRIVATDENKMDYIEYRWNDEESQIVEAEGELAEIETSVSIKQGTNTLKVLAVDRAGNEQEKEQAFQGKVMPKANISINSEQPDRVIIEATCEDGLSKVDFTLNEHPYIIPLELSYTKEDWASRGVILEYSEDGKIISMKYTHMLVEGVNKFYGHAYSLEGLVVEFSGDTIYTPGQ